jgi:hypothetical protein
MARLVGSTVEPDDPAARYRPGRTGAAAGALGRSTEGDHRRHGHAHGVGVSGAGDLGPAAGVGVYRAR